MAKDKVIDKITDKDNKKACDYTNKICIESSKRNKYYSYFDEFVSLLSNDNSYVRNRAIALCCAQARWDKENKLDKAIKAMFMLLHDEKPITVRQCLKALQEVVVYKPELNKKIKKELDTIDLNNYKDSMVPLIKKDIDELKRMIG